MRTLFINLFLILLLVTVGKGEVSIYGYFEPQLSATFLEDEFLHLSSNKLRIDLKSYLSEDIIFTGNFNYINYNGKKVWDLLDFLPEELVVGIPEESRHRYLLKYEDEGKLDNAYLRFYSKYFTLTLGKQQISVGSGYAWNPTDLFNLKDIINPTYEQPGVNGLRMDIGLSADHTIQMFYSPEDEWRSSGKLLRFLGRLSHFDYAFCFGEIKEEFTDYTTFVSDKEKKEMLGFDLNEEILGLGCWSENSYNFMENSKDYWENLLGIDYTFISGWYLMVEFYHNERGKIDYHKYSLNDWMSYLYAETKTLAQDQLYFYTYYPLTDLLTIGGSSVWSISDESLSFIPTLEYSMKNNLTLTFFGSIYTGKEGVMYSKDLGQGGMLRLRAYF